MMGEVSDWSETNLRQKSILLDSKLSCTVRWTMWDSIKLHVFTVITIFLALTLKTKTTDMPEHQRGINQIIFTLHPENLYPKWK